MKNFMVICLVIVGFITGIGVLLNIYLADDASVDDAVKVQVYQVNEGYAYNILVENQIFIKQQYVPSVKGLYAFCTQEDAQKTAELVKNRILLHKKPSITTSDLEQLNVSLTCLAQ